MGAELEAAHAAQSIAVPAAADIANQRIVSRCGHEGRPMAASSSVAVRAVCGMLASSPHSGFSCLLGAQETSVAVRPIRCLAVIRARLPVLVLERVLPCGVLPHAPAGTKCNQVTMRGVKVIIKTLSRTHNRALGDTDVFGRDSRPYTHRKLKPISNPSF